MNLFYVAFNGYSWFVKSQELFEQQGGKTEPWGKNWKPIWANTIEHARDKAKAEQNA